MTSNGWLSLGLNGLDRHQQPKFLAPELPVIMHIDQSFELGGSYVRDPVAIIGEFRSSGGSGKGIRNAMTSTLISWHGRNTVSIDSGYMRTKRDQAGGCCRHSRRVKYKTHKDIIP